MGWVLLRFGGVGTLGASFWAADGRRWTPIRKINTGRNAVLIVVGVWVAVVVGAEGGAVALFEVEECVDVFF